MEKLIIKLAPRIPELIARAMAGDLYAISVLTLMGIGAAATCLKDKD